MSVDRYGNHIDTLTLADTTDTAPTSDYSKWPQN